MKAYIEDAVNNCNIYTMGETRMYCSQLKQNETKKPDFWNEIP